MKAFKFIIFLVPLFLIISCDDDNYETLPNDLDNVEQHDSIEQNDTDITEENCDEGFTRYGENCIKTALAVATTEGYNTPNGGHVYIAENENLSDLQEKTFSESLGDTSGTDISLASSGSRLMVIERNTTSKVISFTAPLNETETTEEILSIAEGYYNFHDAVYDNASQKYYVSANQSNYIQLFSNNGREEIDLTGFYDDSFSPSPSAMIKIGSKIYIALQMLDSTWTSKGGTVAVYDTESKTFDKITLPFSNPSGKFGWNPKSNPDKIYLACTGAWQERDGGVASISLKDNSVTKILEESSEENSILDVDFVDLSVANDGSLYIVVSDSRDWTNSLIEYKAATGIISQIDTKINGAAAKPVDYSPVTGNLYYFKDDAEKTYLVTRNTSANSIETKELSSSGAAVKVWIRYEE